MGARVKKAKGKPTSSWKGAVVSIHVSPVGSAPMTAIEKARAIPGRGLEGDRYCNQTGTYSDKPGPSREVTLIEIEALEAVKRDYGIELDLGKSRRNLVTRGVPLNHLVGREFRVGEVTLRGIRLCEPCSHLEELTVQGIKQGLIHRGGLRAQILTEGMIRAGDAVQAP